MEIRDTILLSPLPQNACWQAIAKCQFKDLAYTAVPSDAGSIRAEMQPHRRRLQPWVACADEYADWYEYGSAQLAVMSTLLCDSRQEDDKDSGRRWRAK